MTSDPAGSFRFNYGPRVVSGPGSVLAAVDLAPEGPILFVTDATLMALGLPRPLLDALAAAGRQVTVFDAVEEDPSRTTVEGCVAAGLACNAASVIGFGGGSPMDVAKVAAYLIGSRDDLDTIWGVGNAKGRGLPLIMIPTTAGTGSEATPVSVITLSETEKRGVFSPALIATHAILDADLTLGLPRDGTAATGIDAMVHAIEAYTSANARNPMSQMLALQALRLVSANIRIACDDPANREARAAMLLGAHLAGVAFANAPVAAVHALAYPLGSRFHVPHGLSNALMLPHVLRFNMSAAMADYAAMGVAVDPSLAGLGTQEQAQGLVAALESIAADTGLARTLRQVGIGAEHLDMLAADAMLQTRLLTNNPVPVAEADARALYEAAL